MLAALFFCCLCSVLRRWARGRVWLSRSDGAHGCAAGDHEADRARRESHCWLHRVRSVLPAGFFSVHLLWPFALGSVPFAFIGGGVTLPGHWYRALVGVILFAAAARLALESKPVDAPARHRVPLLRAVFAGAGIGMLSGLTGTGGGIFLSPLLLFTVAA